MKKITFSLLLSIVLLACSKADTNTNTDSDGSKIKSVKKFGNAGNLESTTNYEYNADGNVSKRYIMSFQDETTTSFTYDVNGKLSSFTEETTDPFNDRRTEINDLLYENGLIVKICQDITYASDDPSPYDFPETDKIEFVYDTFKNVNLFRHYYDERAEFYTCDEIQRISNTETLEFNSSGNMIYYENSFSFFVPVYYKYEYDDKNHPYANYEPAYLRKLFGFSAVNNIISANEYSMETDELMATIVYNYTFNSNNFPVSLEKVYTDISGDFWQTTTYEYTYY